jgi:hypothetical protein
MQKVLKKLRGNLAITLVVIGVGTLGLILTLRSFAATGDTVATEAEAGTRSGNAVSVDDGGASGGKAIAFRAGDTNPGGAYNTAVLADNPVLFLPMTVTGNTEKDLGSGNHTAAYKPSAVGKTTMPNGDPAAVFNGSSNYLEVNDADDLSIPTTKLLTIEAWMRPDVLNFAHTSADGYVHWMGKGVGGQHEYVSRMYNKDTGRPNRISGYAYNADGGLGAGSYFEDPTTAGQWIHYTIVIDSRPTGAYPLGFIKIYKNGVKRDEDTLAGEYNIHPTNGTAPFRVGTRDFVSGYFQGAVGKVAIYNTALTDARIMAHYQAMK